jgi:hypothetical protein
MELTDVQHLHYEVIVSKKKRRGWTAIWRFSFHNIDSEENNNNIRTANTTWNSRHVCPNMGSLKKCMHPENQTLIWTRYYVCQDCSAYRYTSIFKKDIFLWWLWIRSLTLTNICMNLFNEWYTFLFSLHRLYYTSTYLSFGRDGCMENMKEKEKAKLHEMLPVQKHGT